MGIWVVAAKSIAETALHSNGREAKVGHFSCIGKVARTS